MDTLISKWKQTLLAALTLPVLAFNLGCANKEEFCPVIDDLRDIDAVSLVNMFDHSKVAYFVDLHHGYQILVKKSHLNKASQVLSKLNIPVKSGPVTGCKLVN